LDPETCLELSDYPGDSFGSALINGANMLLAIGGSLGLPGSTFGFSAESDDTQWLTKCQLMGQRALEVSKNRMR
jgi:hypothetical protein